MKYLLAAILGSWLVSAASAASPFSFREISPSGLQLSDGGSPVFVYNFGMVLAPGFPETMRRSCYLQPVYAPDGTLLTTTSTRTIRITAASPGCGRRSMWTARRATSGW